MNPKLIELQQLLGYEFNDISLLSTACAHSTYANAFKAESNERLEFLGDAALGLLTAEYLYKRFPSYSEGKLTALKNVIISKQATADYVTEKGLMQFLNINMREQDIKTKIVSSFFESLLGAIYLDGGIEAYKPNIEKYFDSILTKIEQGEYSDYKTQLQEIVQATDKAQIEYIYKGSSDGVALCVVKIGGVMYGSGTGQSRAQAEQQCARIALKKLQKGVDR